MLRSGKWCWLMAASLIVGPVGLLAFAAPRGEEDDKKAETIPNPAYKHWSAFKVGTTVTVREKVKFPAESEEGQRYHKGTLVKDITYTLTEVTPAKAVVTVVETEHARNHLQESAPFKMIYPAAIEKGLGTPKESFAKHKQEDVEVKLSGKTYKATLIDTTHKLGGLTKMHQVWVSDDVPGGIVKDIRSEKDGEKIISESTLEVTSFMPAQ
jgi:hypothetical protein